MYVINNMSLHSTLNVRDRQLEIETAFTNFKILKIDFRIYQSNMVSLEDAIMGASERKRMERWTRNGESGVESDIR